MLVQITHLKAPWPDGAQIGDTISFDVVPAWAAGKCEPVVGEREFIVNPAPTEPADEVPESIRGAEAQAAEEREELMKRAKKAAKKV